MFKEMEVHFVKGSELHDTSGLCAVLYQNIFPLESAFIQVMYSSIIFTINNFFPPVHVLN